MKSRVKEWIVRSGMKNDQVAEILGVSRESVSKWCNNKTVPTLRTAFRLAKLLNCTVDDLFNTDDVEI